MYDFIASLKTISVYIGLGAIPFFTWKHLLNVYKKEIETFEKDVLNAERHNCVLVYSKNKGFSGWPPIYNRTIFDLKDVDSICEPIMFFIRTAKKSLDFCIMNLNVKRIIDLILEVHDRGIKVRILTDINMGNPVLLKPLMQKGIDVVFFISKKNNRDSIMHQKYIIKDFDCENSSLLIGSLNVSTNSMWNSYDALVITQSRDLLKATQQNFDHIWKTISDENCSEYNQFYLKKL